MSLIFTAIYSLAFAAVTNCFAFVYKDISLLTFCIFGFVFLNLFAGLFIGKTKSKRLHVLNHGTTLLISFVFSVAVGITLHLLMMSSVIAVDKIDLIYSIIYGIVCNFLLFWNGIICVYLTSVQLGIKVRIIGLICGLIPILNLVVFGVIINKTYSEFAFETQKERINRARSKKKICKTKYPILLVHGVFFRDNKHLNYWGRIPKELETNGATVFYGNHQSAASVEQSAAELAVRIKEITEHTGCEKVNIIAHSKGGLDCRYATENCGVKNCIASLTTVNTPHRGCVFAEWLLNNAPKTLKEKVAEYYNNAARLLGDKQPDFIAAVSDLQAGFCKEFDSNTAIPDGVYCKSIGSVMNRAGEGKFPLNLSYNFVKYFDGKNDGLVGIDSFKWGSDYTLIDLPVKRGISHADMIDLNRENIKGFDVREFYVGLVSELKQKGL